MNAGKLLIAGGGTGGHLFSGLAVAEEWTDRGRGVVFVGTRDGLERGVVPRYGYRLRTVYATPFKGKNFLGRAVALMALGIGFFQAVFVLLSERPIGILGIGGYASGPAILAAWFLRKKRAILDQNSIPGMMNRFLGRFAQRIFLTYEASVSFFCNDKCRVYGNPVMQRRGKGIDVVADRPRTLFVCGGSQGAHAINRFFLEALPDILGRVPSLRLIHQTGETDSAWVSGELKKMGIQADVAPFFDAMEEKYRQAHLVVSRAGAGTITELALWGKPSILIPYPHAADNHQTRNAEITAREGAAVVLSQEGLNGKILAQTITDLLADSGRLDEMARSAKRIAKPDAAKRIVDELIEMCR